MTILHVTDFHYQQRWFDWLLDQAPPHELLVMSGDMLDLAAATPQSKQIAWVSSWLNDYPGPLCVCSGNHDLEWDAEGERLMPAYWLRDLVNPKVWIDGQRVVLDGLSILNVGCTTRPKGGEADIWVAHAPPAGTSVSQRASGGDGGDPDLVAPLGRYVPRLVLSGHVHHPRRWRHRVGSTLCINPGRSPNGPTPNYVLLNTETMDGQLFTPTNGHEAQRDLATIDAEAPAAEAEVATWIQPASACIESSNP